MRGRKWCKTKYAAETVKSFILFTLITNIRLVLLKYKKGIKLTPQSNTENKKLVNIIKSKKITPFGFR